MKPSIMQTVYIRGQDAKYHCHACKFWIEGIGNWGGCAIVGNNEGEIDGLHIHRKSSCKYWERPDTNNLAQVSDTSSESFDKAEALYGAADDLPANPRGFQCGTCAFYNVEGVSCSRFGAAGVMPDDASDGWQPNSETVSAMRAYDDQVPPKNIEEALRYADLYGPVIGSEVRNQSEPAPEFVEKSCNDDEIDLLIKCLKSQDDLLLDDFYKARGFPIGTKKVWGGIEYVKTADGWEKVKSGVKQSKKEDEIKVGDKNFKVVDKIDLKNSPKTAEHAAEAFKVEDESGKQRYLFLGHDGKWRVSEGLDRKEVDVEGMGDKELDEPKSDKKEPEQPKTEEKPAASEKPVDTAKIEGSPRNESQKEFDEQKETDYAFARNSDFSNLGEDLLGSARHKRNEWRGIDQAEADGTAAKQVTRENLLKEIPIDLVAKTNADNAMVNIVGYSLLKKFPGAPVYPGDKESGDYYATQSQTYSGVGVKYVSEEYFKKYIEGKGKDDLYQKVDGEEVRKKIRKQYFDTFMDIKNMIENESTNTNDLGVVMKNYKGYVSNKIKELRTGDPYNTVANQLVDIHNKTLKDWGGVKKNSAVYELNEMVAHLKKEIPENAPDRNNQIKARLTEMAKDYMEGTSLNNVLGRKSDRKKYFDPAEFYIQDRAEREGPPVELGDQKRQEQMLTDEFKMRGVQWGNSVTDEERKHHLSQVNMAMADLTDILDLPKEMASFNGRLGLAIGARGVGTALAHYEPSSKIINLTRKNGVGSLAHEWGHFFDNVIENMASGKNNLEGYMSESTLRPNYAKFYNQNIEEKGLSETMSSYNGLNAEIKKFANRLKGDKDALTVMSMMKGGQYWLSERELFARSFERYIGQKLESQGRKNAYLSENVKHTLWPTDDEVEAMKPHFDAIFASFKKSPSLTKSFLEAVCA